jgi:hypothetical protein
LFSRVLLFNILKNLVYICFGFFVTSKYFLSNCPGYYSNHASNRFIGYKIVNISFNLVEEYSMKITNVGMASNEYMNGSRSCDLVRACISSIPS